MCSPDNTIGTPAVSDPKNTVFTTVGTLVRTKAALKGLGREFEDEELGSFIKANGGIDAFHTMTKTQIQAIANESGAFTSRALVPGGAPASAVFAGPRQDSQRTKVSDLKSLPLIPTG